MDMESWADLALSAGLIFFILLPLYMVIHMIYNRVKGKDELYGLFRFRIKKRNK